MDSVVLVNNHTVSTTVNAPRVLLVTLLTLPAYSKACAWQAVMGGDRVKVKGLKVVKIFAEKNYILVSGSVPGHIGAVVIVQK